MIIIADSGSTKTDWCVVNHGKQVKRITTEGTNPFFQTEEEISQVVKDKLMPHLDGVKIDAVYFYGAGCAFPEKNEIVHNAIHRHIPVTIEVGSDLLAAARSLCGHKAGIACIMGTGSNSCYYDGKEIVNNISPLGYILGDEGSGAVLGKLLVGDCLKNQLMSFPIKASSAMPAATILCSSKSSCGKSVPYLCGTSSRNQTSASASVSNACIVSGFTADRMVTIGSTMWISFMASSSLSLLASSSP